MITIENLHLTYRGHENFHALKGVSLELPRGEFLTLLGPSSCSICVRKVSGPERSLSSVTITKCVTASLRRKSL